MRHVENMKFDTPLDKEYKRQTRIKANRECRHLKGLEEVRLLTEYGYESYIGCKKCGKLLLPDEVKEVEKTLKKFKNLNK